MSDTVFVVSRHLDQIKEKTKAQADKADSFWGEQNKVNRDPRFSTREESNRFIIQRANKALDCADKAVIAAKRRVSKCEKKFGFRL